MSGRKRRGFAVFSLPRSRPTAVTAVLYRTLQKTEWQSHYCYEECRIQGEGRGEVGRGGEGRGGEGPQNTAVQTLLLNMA